MKFLRQILLIFLFSFLGELLHGLIPWPIPASIYGMVLLFLALALKIIRIEWIKDSGTFLVSLLPLLFVAPIVSLLDCWDQIRPYIIPILLILIFTTVLCFAVAGWITQWLVRKEGADNG